MTSSDKQLTTCLWFDGRALEAARFYADLFGGSVDGDPTDYPEGGMGEAGEPMTVGFEILGQRFVGLNGGPMFTFNEAISFQIPCADQQEVDHYWDALTADGGAESQCGWCKDRFGVSWQVVPTALPAMFSGDPAKAAAVNKAMMPMRKLDIATLQAAYDGA